MSAEIISMAEYRERRARRPRAELFVGPVAVLFVAWFYVAMSAWLMWCVPALAHPLVHLPF